MTNRSKTIFLGTAILLGLTVLAYLSTARYYPVPGGLSSPDAYQITQSPMSLAEAQRQVGFTIATLHNPSMFSQGTKLVGVFVHSERVVQLVYWNKPIAPGITSFVDIYSTGGFTLLEWASEATSPKEAVERYQAGLISVVTEGRTTTFNDTRIITYNDRSYLVTPQGLVWWRNGIMLVLELALPRELFPKATFAIDKLSLQDMLALAETVS